MSGEEKKEELRKNYWTYTAVALGIGVLFDFGFVQSFMGISNVIFGLAMLGVLAFLAKKLDLKPAKGSKLLMVGMGLLSVCGFFTANGGILFFNWVFYCGLGLLLILKNLYETKEWGLMDYFANAMVYLFEGLMDIGDLFSNYSVYKKQYEKGQKNSFFADPKVRSTILGIVIALPIALIVLALLASSDVIYGNVVGQLFGSLFEVDFIVNAFFYAFFCVAVGVGSYTYLSQFAGRKGKEPARVKLEKRQPFAAIAFLAVMLILYLSFCGIQVGALFMGKMQLPKGYTYSEYAREGFGQLLFVCMVNFVIVLALCAFFHKNNLLKGMLSLTTICTYIMIASSAYRMWMYVDAYGLTRKRVLVFWCLAVLAIWFVGMLCLVWKEHFDYFSYAVVTFMAVYLVLGFSRMDYWIAKYDLSMQQIYTDEEVYAEQDYDEVDQVTVDYLAYNLSLDAYPVFAENKDKMTKDGYEYCQEQMEDMNFGIRGFHLSKYLAKKSGFK